MRKYAFRSNEPLQTTENLLIMNHLQRPIQLINILQTEIFQADVVDATLVIPWHNGVSHNDNLTVGVVDAA